MSIDPNGLIPCKRCKHFLNCVAIFGCEANSTKCDWEPSRFALATDSPIDSRGESVTPSILEQADAEVMAHQVAHDAAIEVLRSRLMQRVDISQAQIECISAYIMTFYGVVSGLSELASAPSLETTPLEKAQAALREIMRFNHLNTDLDAYLFEMAEWGMEIVEDRPRPESYGVPVSPAETPAEGAA